MESIILLLVLIIAFMALIIYRLTRKEEITSVISSNSSPNFKTPLEEWQEFLSKADWKTILEIKNQFTPCVLNKQDNALWNMLHDYLLKTEHPILSDEILFRITNKIIWVDGNATDNEIKRTVKMCFKKISKPAFVITKTYELIGFALSEDLIIYGSTSVCTYPETAVVKATVWRKSLLTKEDSQILEANMDELDEMTQLVNVPSLRWTAWMIQNKPNATIYDSYSLSHPKRYIYFEFDDPTPIIVKL
jgi:hypothetical protein